MGKNETGRIFPEEDRRRMFKLREAILDYGVETLFDKLKKDLPPDFLPKNAHNFRRNIDKLEQGLGPLKSFPVLRRTLDIIGYPLEDIFSTTYIKETTPSKNASVTKKDINIWIKDAAQLAAQEAVKVVNEDQTKDFRIRSKQRLYSTVFIANSIKWILSNPRRNLKNTVTSLFISHSIQHRNLFNHGNYSNNKPSLIDRYLSYALSDKDSPQLMIWTMIVYNSWAINQICLLLKGGKKIQIRYSNGVVITYDLSKKTAGIRKLKKLTESLLTLLEQLVNPESDPQQDYDSLIKTKLTSYPVQLLKGSIETFNELLLDFISPIADFNSYDIKSNKITTVQQYLQMFNVAMNLPMRNYSSIENNIKIDEPFNITENSIKQFEEALNKLQKTINSKYDEYIRRTLIVNNQSISDIPDGLTEETAYSNIEDAVAEAEVIRNYSGSNQDVIITIKLLPGDYMNNGFTSRDLKGFHFLGSEIDLVTISWTKNIALFTAESLSSMTFENITFVPTSSAFPSKVSLDVFKLNIEPIVFVSMYKNAKTQKIIDSLILKSLLSVPAISGYWLTTAEHIYNVIFVNCKIRIKDSYPAYLAYPNANIIDCSFENHMINKIDTEIIDLPIPQINTRSMKLEGNKYLNLEVLDIKKTVKKKIIINNQNQIMRETTDREKNIPAIFKEYKREPIEEEKDSSREDDIFFSYDD